MMPPYRSTWILRVISVSSGQFRRAHYCDAPIDHMFGSCRNFRLADLVTIMNGFCGSFSIFSSARYLITNDTSYLYAALAYPLAGLMFDFFDGKVARWRQSSSLLGQELDSLADLVSQFKELFDSNTNINTK